MTREQALAEVHKLALGLAPDLAGVARLMERVANHDQAEALFDALVEVGIEAVLDAAQTA